MKGKLGRFFSFKPVEEEEEEEHLLNLQD